MDYDNIILHVGGFGRYQRAIFFLLSPLAMFAAIHTMAGVFLAARTDFRCSEVRENLENATFKLPASINGTSFNLKWDDATNEWSRCERYDGGLERQYNLSSDENFTSPNISTVYCDHFVYDDATYELTVVTEFNLVCEKKWLKAAADSLYMLGMMIGAIISGGLSDKYGRRPVLYISLISVVISGVLVSISPEIISYITFRLIVAICVGGMYLVSYVLAIETAGPKIRSMVGVGMFFFFTMGSISTSGFAYFIRNWRILQIAITVPNFIFLLSWWFIPESVRWLLSRGRVKEAKYFLSKIASKNGVELSQDALAAMLSIDQRNKPDHKKPASTLDLLRYPNLRRKTVLLSLIWFVISCTYYGLSWNTSNLGYNDFSNFALSGCSEIPAHISVFFLLNKWGRRIVLCSFASLAGISLLLTLLVPVDVLWLKMVLTMIGKSAITGSFCATYVFTAEQYPTVIRNVGVGICSIFARIGGMVAPVIIHYSINWKPLISVTLGSGSLIAALLATLLPETLNKKLPDSIEEGERFGVNK